MTDLDFESSQIQLLTDALRAGPGTPEWRAAIESIAAAGGTPAEEYKFLYAARERLASGRQYREVRAGPGFTRKVFDAIEHEGDADGAAPGAMPAANLIAAISALVILGVLAVVVWLIVPSRDARQQQQQGNELAQTYFVDRIVDANFSDRLDSNWSRFGKLPVDVRNGLRPGVAPDAGEATYLGGGVFHNRAIDAKQPFALEATIRIPKPADAAAVQVFVTDSPTFAGDRAMTDRELVWHVRGSQATVATPDGAVELADDAGIRPGQRINVRIATNQSDAAVEMNGRKLWSGPHKLDPAKPRTVGVRFLTQGKVDEKAAPVAESVRVLTPQKQ
jgi:hypothetical protein